MRYIRPRGFKIFDDRHGKTRCYHRKTNIAVDLVKFPIGSAEFFAECARITALAERSNKTKPGSLGMLVGRYRADIAFTDLADRTKSDYDRFFNFLKPIADTPLVKFDTPFIVRIRDRAASKHGRHFANYLRKVMSLLFEWGRERGYVATNPAYRIKGLKRPKGAPRANRPWQDAEREAVMEALPPHMRLAVALMMYCGIDPQDALRLPKTAIGDGKIDTRRGKTGAGTKLPLPGPVIEAIAAAPAHDAITLCANSRGKPWTVSGFRASWRPVRQKLEAQGLVAPGLTLKGLRHTVATILAEIGYDERTIADALQQRTTAMARHYSDQADKTRKLTGVVADFEAELNKRRTKNVKPK